MLVISSTNNRRVMPLSSLLSNNWILCSKMKWAQLITEEIIIWFCTDHEVLNKLLWRATAPSLSKVMVGYGRISAIRMKSTRIVCGLNSIRWGRRHQLRQWHRLSPTTGTNLLLRPSKFMKTNLWLTGNAFHTHSVHQRQHQETTTAIRTVINWVKSLNSRRASYHAIRSCSLSLNIMVSQQKA